MTGPFILGALAGLGLFLLGYALRPPRPRLTRQLAEFDAARRSGNGHWPVARGGADGGLRGAAWRVAGAAFARPRVWSSHRCAPAWR